MSRQELADACNTELEKRYSTQGRRRRWAGMTERAIGALERGEIRWPNEDYRWALCLVLGADERRLGLYIDRPLSDDTTPGLSEGPVSGRGFFGIGPLTLAVPLRDVPGRALPMIASEDARARDILRELLERHLSFAVKPFSIPVSGMWEPHGDVIAICGPKSSPVTAEALCSDPVLSFLPDDSGRWAIRDSRTGHQFGSPMDSSAEAAEAAWSDVAYLGRLQVGQQRLLVIAGVHALGSVGAVDYLVRELSHLYAAVGEKRFSMVIGSVHDGDKVLSSQAVIPPCLHE